VETENALDVLPFDPVADVDVAPAPPAPTTIEKVFPGVK
jgi:hypothetical protein